jgi:hypothetical protein
MSCFQKKRRTAIRQIGSDCTKYRKGPDNANFIVSFPTRTRYEESADMLSLEL